MNLLNEFYSIYILKCNDGTYYVGCSSNLVKRLLKHQKGMVKYTQTRLPFELISYHCFAEKHKAYLFEKYLKSGSGHAFRNKRLI